MLIIKLLGIRLFNGSASSLNLLLSSYYQTSALQDRDILETSFLIDFFSIDKSAISQWKACSEDQRLKEYGPAAIRKALDDRDGFRGRKREAHYKMLCKLAGHPTYLGFRMLTPILGGQAHSGPYFAFESLEASLAELAKLMVYTGSMFMTFFKNKTHSDLATKLMFLEKELEWCEEFFGRIDTYNHQKMAELRALISQYKVECL